MEFPGLWVIALPEGNLQKMQMEPLGHESCGNGSSDAPRRYVGHGEVIGDRFSEDLHHGPDDATDLHPAFENRASLLSEVRPAVPVKTGGTAFQQSVWTFLRTYPLRLAETLDPPLLKPE